MDRLNNVVATSRSRSYEHPTSFRYRRGLIMSVKIYILPKKHCSIVLCLFPSVSVTLRRFLASSSRFLRSYVTFSAALFLDFTAFRLIHLAYSFFTIAFTPLRHLSLFTAVLRKISRCLPLSRSSIVYGLGK